MAKPKYTFKRDLKIDDIPCDHWNRLVGESVPMMRWEWYAAMEHSKSIGGKTGFRPAHLGVYRGKKLVAVVPLYWKSGPLAEWTAAGYIAEMSARGEGPPPPRLVGLMPFTPVPGYTPLLDEEEDGNVLVNAILKEVQRQVKGRKSLVQFHHSFVEYPSWHKWADKLTRLGEEFIVEGWEVENSYTYRWFNRGYETMEDFIQTYSSSRRNKMRREIKAMDEEAVTFRSLRGSDITSTQMDLMFMCYEQNCGKHYGDVGSIQPEFWEEIGETFRDYIHLVIGERDGEILSVNFQVESDEALFGRWWGSFEYVPFLHFNACYYYPIEYAIETGKKYIDPGYQGKFKQWRGFERIGVPSYFYTGDTFLRSYILLALNFLASREDSDF